MRYTIDKFAQNSDKGLLLCSIVHSKYSSGRPSTSYFIRQIGSNEAIIIFGHNKLMQGVFGVSGEIEDDGPGSVKILELPQGEYEIFKWGLFFNHGTIQWAESSEKDFSIPFVIKDNSINYLGQIRLKNYQISFSDKFERDLKIARSHNYGIDGLEINKQDLKCVSGCQVGIEDSDHFIHIPPPLN